MNGGHSMFEKHEIVGKGAYGAVYRGTNKQTGEVVALKVIDLEHPDNEDLHEIQREVALLSQLRDAASHNITLYYGCWVQQHELWIAMDYASGGSIRTLMKAGPIEERLCVVIVREVLIALAYLARENIIHRDIKAANILLTQNGRILLCDFGVAAHLNTSSKRSTFIGTPYWMAPEVIKEGKMYDTKADLWSLGVTVYEIANGNPPYAKLEPLRAIAMIPHSEPAKLEGNQWSQAMKDFMALCLTKEPKERPSADELSRTKWIKGAAKVPTSLLRELIVRYGAWVNAGGVRMSIIGDVARRDDTFEIDVERPSSWLFDDDDDDLQTMDTLGDEPDYNGNHLSRDGAGFARDADAPTARRPPAGSSAGASHRLMQLFDAGNTSTNDPYSYGGSGSRFGNQSLGASTNSSNWSNTETLRPGSITIPDLDDSSSSAGISLPAFEDSGVSAWAPASTPWYKPSEMSVGRIQMEAELIEPGSEEAADNRFAPGDTHAGSLSFSSNGSGGGGGLINLPSDSLSPTTVKPSWARGAEASFNVFNPNPFPSGAFSRQKGRQASNDSLFGPSSASGGQFGGPTFGTSMSGSTLNEAAESRATAGDDSHRGRFPNENSLRSDSPESFGGLSERAGNMSSSPSLPSMPRPRQDDADGPPTARNAQSPTNVTSAMHRLRANTAPNHDSGLNPDGGSKSVLNFAKKSPFAQAREAMQKKPAALQIPSNDASMQSGPLTPRSGPLDIDDNLLTPMPSAMSVQTPTTNAFPFPTPSGMNGTASAASLLANSSSSASSSSSSSITRVNGPRSGSGSASTTTTTSTSGASMSSYSSGASLEWPKGPPARSLDFAVLGATAAAVQPELEKILKDLGGWLATVDTGMTQILADCA